MRAVGGLAAARAKHHPEANSAHRAGTNGAGQAADDVAWWWRLDEHVQQDRVRSLRRTGLTLGIAAAVIVGALLLFQRLFPVDPQVQAALSAQTAGEQKIMSTGDFAAALEDFRQAAEHTPDDPDVWIRIGAVLEKLGDQPEAEENFERGRQLAESEAAFRLARASIYLTFLMNDQALADLQAVLMEDPENPVAYYYLGTVYESQGQIELAVDALEKASNYASEANESELVALARYRMGMLMQQMQVGGAAQATPTVTPAP
jgi:tetratricopeptide (TPR) repeat protein